MEISKEKSNDTRIQYVSVAQKIYKIERISFYYFTVEAKETDLTLADVPVEQVFDISNFKEFHVKLRNWHGNVTSLIDYQKSVS